LGIVAPVGSINEIVLLGQTREVQMKDVAETSQVDMTLTGKDVKHNSSVESTRRILEALGFQWRPKGIDGAPDFAHHDAKVAVFIHACIRDGCPVHGTVGAVDDNGNKRHWYSENDLRVDRLLTFQRWRIIRACEHDLHYLSGHLH
jgi:G:T-mismatch repair DNA endonuclease (very short patch repair protein)